MIQLAFVITCAVLLLTFAADAVVNNTVTAAFEAFLKESHTTYKSAISYGAGPGFTGPIMHDAQFKFALKTNHEHSGELVEFAALEESLILCRLENYLEKCNHPFAGDLGKTDIQAPYHLDFSVHDSILQSPSMPDLQNFPLFVCGVSPVFNLPGITRLVLTKLTLAKIFRGCDVNLQAGCLSGSITMWNDQAIKDTNDIAIHPLLDAAGPIKVIVFSEARQSTASFKRALSEFDPDFATQIGQNASSVWPGTDHGRHHGSHGVLFKVRTTPGSISYSRISSVAEQPGVHNVELLTGHADNPVPVYPNTDSLFAAFQEIGLDFGNDGSPKSRLTVDLTDALGRRGWPIVSLGYLALRLNATSGTHEHCVAKKTAMLGFFEHLYSNQGFGSNLFRGGVAPMTTQAGAEVLELIRSKLRCDGELVYKYPALHPKVTIQADESLHDTLAILGSASQDRFKSQLAIQPVASHLTIKRTFTCLADAMCTDVDGGFVVLADENLSSYIIRDDIQEEAYKLISIPYCAMATGFIHNFCTPDDSNCPYQYQRPLVLDLETTAMILDLDIIWWNDTRIQALNPEKLLPPFPIEVVSGPKTSTFHFAFIDNMRRSYYPSFSFLGGGVGQRTYLQAWLEVSLQPYTIAFVPFNGTNVEGASKVSLISRQGVPVAPTVETIEACARDTYDEAGNVFFLSSSLEPNCYPMVQVFNLFMRNPVKFATSALLTQYLYHRAVRINVGDETVFSVSGLGSLVDIKLPDGLDLAERNFEVLESITMDDGTNVLMVQHDLTLIPQTLIIVMYTLLAMELLFFASLGVWVVVHRNRKLVRNSSPVFMMQVLVGAAIMACTVIPLAQQDSDLVPRGMTEEQLNEPNEYLNRACVAQPILFSLGFFVTFSALFLKSWRLIRIFNNKKLRNLFLRDRQLLVYQLLVIVVVVILNLIWAVQSPLAWQRFSVFTNSDHDLVVSSYGICFSRTEIYPALPLLVGIMLVLVVGNYLSYLGRRIPTEFNESKWTAMTMVMTLEAFVIGLPILMLANSQPVPGFIIKAFSSLLVSGATVGLIFLPKVAMAYGWGVIEGESNPWRFVKGDSSGSGKPQNNKSGSKEGVAVGAGIASMHAKMKSLIQPSLNSLVEGKVVSTMLSDNKLPGQSSQNPFFSAASMSRAGSKKDLQASPSAGNRNSKRLSKEFVGATPSEALAKVLQDDPMRRRFRRYLQTLKMEENVRFWDSVVIFRLEPDEHRRYVSARAIIQTFVLDSSPLQVNLKSDTKSEILVAFSGNDKHAMGSLDFFSAATNELFEDLRQSDAFRRFLENDTFSQDVLSSKSDPLILVADSNQQQGAAIL